MKVLLTGGAGFVGHHIVEHLLKKTNSEIVLLDGLTYSGDLNRLSNMAIWEKEKHRVKFVYHDLKSPLTDLTHKYIGEVDYIWHLAAESHVDNSLKDPTPFVLSNVLGTQNLLEYAKNFQKVKRFIYFSTDEVFGPAPRGVYYKEGDPFNPSNPYSATKAGGEMIAKAYAFSYGLPVTITRTMNVFGERQHIEKFIPTKIKQSIENGRITLHGLSKSETPSRCWVHARAVAEALLFINEKGEIITKEHQDKPDYGTYHIVGPEYDTYDLAARVFWLITGKEVTENDIDYEDYHKQRPGHDFRYAMSGEKLRKLGYEDKTEFWRSFDKMVLWTKSEYLERF